MNPLITLGLGFWYGIIATFSVQAYVRLRAMDDAVPDVEVSAGDNNSPVIDGGQFTQGRARLVQELGEAGVAYMEKLRAETDEPKLKDAIDEVFAEAAQRARRPRGSSSEQMKFALEPGTRT